MEVNELILRIILGFLVLFTLARMMGRKEISQMTFFNFVSAIAIGSIASNLVVNQNLTIRNGIIALVGWTIFTILMDLIDIKFKKARKVTTGDPVIVIKDGKIVERKLKSSRLDLDALRTMLRQQNIFSISEVDYAIFETNGKLSVLKKFPYQSATRNDINIESATKLFPIATEVISDGQIIKRNLTKLNLDDKWLQQQLQKLGISSFSDVFYAEVLPDGSLFIDQKTKN